MSSNSFAAPSNSMSISPSATDATTITASDENTRNSEVQTKFNAHDHTDITQLGTIGEETVFNPGSTTEDSVTITANSLTGGKGLLVSSSSADTTTRALVKIFNSSSAASGATCVEIEQAAATAATVINAAGDGPHLRFIGDPALAVVGPTDGDMWYTGSALNFHNNTTTTNLLSGVQTASGGQFTRAHDAASGSQSITALGFQPSIIFFSAAVSSADEMSVGYDDGTVSNSVAANDGDAADTWVTNATFSIRMMQTAAIRYEGAIGSFDADGFSIDWTRTGSTAAGTISVEFLAVQ